MNECQLRKNRRKSSNDANFIVLQRCIMLVHGKNVNSSSSLIIQKPKINEQEQLRGETPSRYTNRTSPARAKHKPVIQIAQDIFERHIEIFRPVRANAGQWCALREVVNPLCRVIFLDAYLYKTLTQEL